MYRGGSGLSVLVFMNCTSKRRVLLVCIQSVIDLWPREVVSLAEAQRRADEEALISWHRVRRSTIIGSIQAGISRSDRIPMETTTPVPAKKSRRWGLFGIGLCVRLSGLLLIWWGDGYDNAFRKAMVVIGVILSVGGIGVLRYLLISGWRKKK
jgi:hypothetical protein